MPILEDWEKQELKSYYKRAINDGTYWKQKREEHDKHRILLTESLNENKLDSLSKDELIKLLTQFYNSGKRNGKTSQIQANILKPNNDDYNMIINNIRNLLYGPEDLGIRIDTFSKNIDHMALGYISEMLSYIYPEKYPFWNKTVSSTLDKIGFENLNSYISKGTSGRTGLKYEKIIEVMTSIKNSIEKDENRKLDFIDIKILLLYIEYLPETSTSVEEEPIESELKSKNFIFNGPVGTGKSEFANILAKKIIENRIPSVSEIEQLLEDFNKGDLPIEKYDNEKLRKVTFHPSYGYEDFIMGLKAEVDEKK